ncbi:MAG: dihydrolipoamide acetyltransferase family protein [Polyangiaceae bacterium]
MAKVLDMPKLSPTMEEGVLSAWHKKEGDPVGIDDLLAEVETDKATMEFRAFDKGTLLKILVPAGSNVKLGQPVAVIGNAGEDVSDLVGAAAAKAPEAPKAEAPKAEAKAPEAQKTEAQKTEAPKTEAKPADATAAAPTKAPTHPSRAGAPATRVSSGSALTRTEREPEAATAANGGVLASPYVRKAARDRGIDLAHVRGSGPGGRIGLSDLDGAPVPGTARPANGTSTALAVETALAKPEVRPLSPMRKTIARRLTESKTTVPHFYLTIDVDADALTEFRERINDDLAKAGGKKKDVDPNDRPLKISINDLLIKAVAGALVRVPECNAQFTADAILVHNRVDVSVAVAVPEGLVTPVVRNADQKSVVAIAAEVRDLAARARAKKLKPEEMMDGTFSISNLGMFGIDEFSAVINPPEGAILAVGQTRDVPVVRDGAVVPGKKLALTLSCDHRVIDGAVGASFLAELRTLLEHPMRILTG